MNCYYFLSHCCTVATLHVCSHVRIVSCLQMRNVHYVRAFLSFDWSVCMYPGCMGSRKSQMSMLSLSEPLTIWKSSNCRLYTEYECSCHKSKRNHQSWPLLKLTSQNPIHTIPDCTLIQGHSSRYSRCSGHWIIIILAGFGARLLNSSCFISNYTRNDHNRYKILIFLGGVPPDPHSWCALHAYIISSYIIQALAMGSIENCFLQVCNTTTKGTAMCTTVTEPTRIFLTCVMSRVEW